MKKSDSPEAPLDFSKAVRGRFYEQFQQGTNVVFLEPDVLESFPTSEAVNQALRSLKAGAAPVPNISSRTAKRAARAS